MNLHKEKIEVLIPMFTGVLLSLVLCTFIASYNNLFHGSDISEVTAGIEFDMETEQAQELENNFSFLLTGKNKAKDVILEYYRNPEYREWVVSFFTGICSNKEIAQAVLDGADEFDVSPALAFALSWEESRFNPRAVNLHNYDGSIDRGLFQLNNRSFPNLELIQFFNAGTNARYGVSHLRHCLNTGGSEVSALAMYNAGAGRVSNTGTPKVTLDYISRILENRSRIESHFHYMLIREEESRIAENHFVENSHDDFEQPESHSQFSRTLISASPL